MSLDEHRYALTVRWTGNLGEGTASYRGYSRDHDIEIPGLPVLRGSADPTFHGDRTRYNPEQLLLAALSQCHMLSFLHVAVKHGLVVTAYEDQAEGLMRTNRDGSGQFESVTLRPRVTAGRRVRRTRRSWPGGAARRGEQGLFHRPQRQLPGAPRTGPGGGAGRLSRSPASRFGRPAGDQMMRPPW